MTTLPARTAAPAHAPTAEVDWPVTTLAPDIIVRNVPAPAPADAETAQRITEIWRTATDRHPRLYNGRVFCARRLTASLIEGYWAQYREVLAQMRAPELFSRLGHRSLAVTGLLLVPEGVVLGCRSARAIYRPGAWQGVPAGTVEARDEDGPVDLRAQIGAEIVEELGLALAHVTIGPPILACEHPDTHIIDLGMPLHTTLSFRAVEAAWRAGGNDEYDELIVLHPQDALARHDILPTTRAMIEALHP